MKVKEITSAIEAYAPLYLQEDYDNAGMQVGNPEQEITGVLLCTDVREPIVDEAIARGFNLVISHHPLIFHGIKKIAGRNYIERIIAKAIKHDITIYCAHTNIDSARGGVSFKMAQKLGLKNVEILSPRQGLLEKLVTYVPTAQASRVEQAMFTAGAGRLGDYDSCSYRLEGQGRYRALEGATPFAGTVGEHHTEPETRVEVLVHKPLMSKVVTAMLKAHPYEEPAFDIIPLDNADRYSGLGVIGDIEPQPALDFLERVKQAFEVEALRYSGDTGKTVSRIAMCGGAGAEFTSLALARHAQVYITGDLKYHGFMGNEDSIILADIGHYESEHYTKEIFLDIIRQKIPNFAVAFASNEKNQVKYL